MRMTTQDIFLQCLFKIHVSFGMPYFTAHLLFLVHQWHHFFVHGETTVCRRYHTLSRVFSAWQQRSLDMAHSKTLILWRWISCIAMSGDTLYCVILFLCLQNIYQMTLTIYWIAIFNHIHVCVRGGGAFVCFYPDSWNYLLFPLFPLLQYCKVAVLLFLLGMEDGAGAGG